MNNFKQNQTTRSQRETHPTKFNHLFLAAIIASSTLVACGEMRSISENTTEKISALFQTPATQTPEGEAADTSSAQSVAPVFLQYDLNKYPMSKLVCDPLGDPNPPQVNPVGGIKAELYYLKSGQAHFTKVADYINQGTKSEQTLFFSSLNVPTRLFTKGFALESGDMVHDDTGATLIEYFAIRFKTVLKLASDQEDGLYELALLSDDGTTLRMREADGTYSTLINNDGNHPTRMGCATKILDMNKETERLIELDYYQGPRMHIANVLMMRKVTATTPKDPLCGQLGNSLYFDYNNNSKPQKAYNDLLARGWRPATSGNFALAQEAVFNPCTIGNPTSPTAINPVISNVTMLERTNTTLSIAWTTDIPSTSQIQYKEVLAGGTLGSAVLTSVDNQLVQNHNLTLTGLKPLTTYQIEVISVSDTLGRSVSATTLQTEF